MDKFSKFHPGVTFSFFILEIVLTLVFMNPYILVISLFGAFCYLFRINGAGEFKTLFKFILPLVIFVGFFNFLFCRYGETVLFSVKYYNFTLESLLYGAFTGIMLSAVILWFSIYSKIITSEKFMALFGGMAPNLTLLFSMVFRFIPLMKKESREIRESMEGLGEETKGLKNNIKIFSTLISISLEKSIETADSMKARGFGKGKRTSFSRYNFKLNDGILLVIVVFLSAFLLTQKILGVGEFSFDPKFIDVSTNLPLVLAFFLFSFLPIIIDLLEDIKWLFLKSKI